MSMSTVDKNIEQVPLLSFSFVLENKAVELVQGLTVRPIETSRNMRIKKILASNTDMSNDVIDMVLEYQHESIIFLITERDKSPSEDCTDIDISRDKFNHLVLTQIFSGRYLDFLSEYHTIPCVIEFAATSDWAFSPQLELYCPKCGLDRNNAITSSTNPVCITPECGTHSRDFVRLHDFATMPIARPVGSQNLVDDFLAYEKPTRPDTNFTAAFGAAQELGRNYGREILVKDADFSYPLRTVHLFCTDGEDCKSQLRTVTLDKGFYEHSTIPVERRYIKNPIVTFVASQMNQVNKQELERVSENGKFHFFVPEKKLITHAAMDVSKGINDAVAKNQEVEITNSTDKCFYIRKAGLTMLPNAVYRFQINPKQSLEIDEIYLSPTEISNLENVARKEATKQRPMYRSRKTPPKPNV